MKYLYIREKDFNNKIINTMIEDSDDRIKNIAEWLNKDQKNIRYNSCQFIECCHLIECC